MKKDKIEKLRRTIICEVQRFNNACVEALYEKVEDYGVEFLNPDENVCTIDGLYQNQYAHIMEQGSILDLMNHLPEKFNLKQKKRALRLCIHIANRQMMIYTRLMKELK